MCVKRPSVRQHGVTSSEKSKLFATAEPAGDASLGFGGTLLDLGVELVNGLESLSLGLLCVGFGVALELSSLPIGRCPLIQDS